MVDWGPDRRGSGESGAAAGVATGARLPRIRCPALPLGHTPAPCGLADRAGRRGPSRVQARRAALPAGFPPDGCVVGAAGAWAGPASAPAGQRGAGAGWHAGGGGLLSASTPPPCARPSSKPPRGSIALDSPHCTPRLGRQPADPPRVDRPRRRPVRHVLAGAAAAHGRPRGRHHVRLAGGEATRAGACLSGRHAARGRGGTAEGLQCLEGLRQATRAGPRAAASWHLLLRAGTASSQSTFVFTHRFADGTPLHLYMGDRWGWRPLDLAAADAAERTVPQPCSGTLQPSSPTRARAAGAAGQVGAPPPPPVFHLPRVPGGTRAGPGAWAMPATSGCR